MKIIIAPDSFKGSLSSQEAIDIIAAAAAEIFPCCRTVGIPIADGGEGTVNAVIAATNGTLRRASVSGCLFEQIQAHYGILPNGAAIIETAAASGLTLVPPHQRNPQQTTSYGTGELIRHALYSGCRDITIGLGGSATNDGGIGALTALGARFLDHDGNPLQGKGRDLQHIADIDASNLHPAILESTFTLMCDVDNPLLGSDGAAYTFAPQKGASAEDLPQLERGMSNYAQAVKCKLNIDITTIQGGGAAGGIGAAFHAFLGAKIQSGIDTILNLANFDEKLHDTQLVITGEGKLDAQSTHGKAVFGIAARCRTKNVPAIAFAGSIDGNPTIPGLTAAIPITDSPMPLEQAIANARPLLHNAALRTFHLINLGIKLH